MLCTACDAANDAASVYCGRCGAPLPDPQPAPGSLSTGAAPAAPVAVTQVYYCTFLGCAQRGQPTTAVRCPNCRRETSTKPFTAIDLSAPDPTTAANTTKLQLQSQNLSVLSRDAARVGDILSALSWVIVGFGVLLAIGGLVAGFAANQPISAMIAVAASAAYAAAGWAFAMLGSVIARHVALRSA